MPGVVPWELRYFPFNEVGTVSGTGKSSDCDCLLYLLLPSKERSLLEVSRCSVAGASATRPRAGLTISLFARPVVATVLTGIFALKAGFLAILPIAF